MLQSRPISANNESHKEERVPSSNRSISISGNRRAPTNYSTLYLKTDSEVNIKIEECEIKKIFLRNNEMLERIRYHLQNYAEAFLCNIVIVLYKEGELEL